MTLFETTHPGLFKGYLTLVAGGAVTNQLQVQNGDTLTATYFDASTGSNVTATAVIDTVPPVISQVAATTDYFNANVTWLTSKPADSAVQYGILSQPPIKVVYASTLVTNHSVTVPGLLANRIYNYEVVSRDQAGNTTVDDNHGNLYTFQTLKAPAPPWFDNLENGANGWTVVPDPVPRFRYQLDAGHAQQRFGHRRPFRGQRVGRRPRWRPGFFHRQHFFVCAGH